MPEFPLSHIAKGTTADGENSNLYFSVGNTTVRSILKSSCAYTA